MGHGSGIVVLERAFADDHAGGAQQPAAQGVAALDLIDDHAFAVLLRLDMADGLVVFGVERVTGFGRDLDQATFFKRAFELFVGVGDAFQEA